MLPATLTFAVFGAGLDSVIAAQEGQYNACLAAGRTDCRIDFDLSQVLGYKYNTGATASYTDGDLNYDGKVNFFDLSIILSANYNSGQTLGPAAAGAVDIGPVAGVPEMVAVPSPLLLKLKPLGSAFCSRTAGVGYPVVVTVNEAGVPTVKATWSLLVIVGA